MKEIIVNGSTDAENGNKIIAPTNLNQVKVKFHGKNNLVIISPKATKLRELNIEFPTDNAIVMIGNCNISGSIHVGYHSKVIIGDAVTTISPINLICTEQTQIIIGDDCMFTTNNKIHTNNSYAVYDVINGSRLNKSKDIILGTHICVSHNAVILGGTEINMGAIVDYSALVKGKFPNNSLITGNPANVSKKNISWDRPSLLWARDEYTDSSKVKNKIYWDKTKVNLPIFLGDGCSHLLSNIFSYPILDTDKPYFSLDFIKVEDGLLFIKGNALYKGIECYEYNKKYTYTLILKSLDNEFKINLGKMPDPEITKKVFDGRHISYNKSKFTTLKNQGILLDNIPTGDYTISVNMSVHNQDYLFNVLDYLDATQKKKILEQSFSIHSNHLMLSL